MVKNYMVNVVNENDMEQLIQTVLHNLSDKLSKSLGPYGATTLIQTADEDIMTKDGFTIFSHIRYNNGSANSIYRIIKEIATKVVLSVGDGTTTSIVAARFLYDGFKKLKDRFPELSQREFLNMIENEVDIICEDLLSHNTISKKLSEDLRELENIATISLNNNKDLGKLIYQIYNENGKNVFIETKIEYNQDVTSFTKNKGFAIDRGYLDPVLINNPDRGECSYDNPKILMLRGVIGLKDIGLINMTYNTLVESNTPLILVAPDYTSEARQEFVEMFKMFRRDRNTVPKFNIIKLNNVTDHGRELFEDLAILTGTTVIDNITKDFSKQEELEKILSEINDYFGSAGNVTSTYKQTFFRNCDNDVVVSERIATIEHERDTLASQNQLNALRDFELGSRIASLKNVLITIHIGGKSNQERKATKDLIDDALMACKSAIRHGYVMGGSLAIPCVIKNIGNCDVSPNGHHIIVNAIRDTISRAFRDIFIQILSNKIVWEGIDAEEIMNISIESKKAYDIITTELSDEIINPVETEVQILKQSVSIVTMLMTSNQMITVNPETKVCE